MSRLSDLLIAANAEKLSGRAIAARAQAAGHNLNHDTVARYLRGAHGLPDESTLLAFAEVLPITLSELRAAAELPSEVVEPYRPPPESSRLTRRQRRAIDELIRTMVGPVAGRDQARRLRAARRGDSEPSA